MKFNLVILAALLVIVAAGIPAMAETTSDLSNVALYLPLSRNFEDYSLHNITIVNTLNTRINTTSYKFFPGSAFFDSSGTSGLYIKNTSLNLSSPNFTVSFWLYSPGGSSAAYNTIFHASSLYSLLIRYESDNTIYAWAASTTSSWDIFTKVSMGTINTTGYSYYSIQKLGTTVHTYKDGALVSSRSAGSGALPLITSNSFIGIEDIGTNPAYNMNLQDFKITIDNVDFDSAVPAAPTVQVKTQYSPSWYLPANTLSDYTDQSLNYATSSGTSGGLLGYYPNTTGVDQSLFTNGAGLVSYAANPGYNLESAYTIGMWYRPGGTSGTILESYDGYNGWFIDRNSNYFRLVTYNAGTSTVTSSTNTFGSGSWYYVLATSDGSYNYLYINGVQEAKVATTTVGKASGNLLIGGNLTTAKSAGYIADAWILNSTYIGNASGTVPTTAFSAYTPVSSFSSTAENGYVSFTPTFTANARTAGYNQTGYKWYVHNSTGMADTLFSTSASTAQYSFTIPGSYTVTQMVSGIFGTTNITQAITASLLDPNSRYAYVPFPATQIANQTSRTGTVIFSNITGADRFTVYGTYPIQYSVKSIAINSSAFGTLSLSSSAVGNGYFTATVTSSSGITAGTAGSPILDFQYYPITYQTPGTAGTFTFNLVSSTYRNASTLATVSPRNAGSATVYAGTWGPITNSLTANKTITNKDSPIQFTAITGGYPTAYNWSFGDGNYSTSQNPVYSYPQGTPGGYKTITMTAYVAANTTITNTTIFNNYIYVNLSGLAQYDLAIGELYQRLVYVRDATTSSLITTSNVTDSSGDNLLGGNGAFYNYYYQGSETFTATATGYYSNSATVDVLGTGSTTIYLSTVSTASDNTNTIWSPHNVEIKSMDVYGIAIPNTTITLTAFSTTATSWDWLKQMLGFSASSGSINQSVMTATTDYYGEVSVLLIPAVNYHMTAVASGYTFAVRDISGSQDKYNLIADVNTTDWWGNSKNQQLDTNVTVTANKINSTYGLITVTYDDPNLVTTGGSINIYKANSTHGGAKILITSMPITGNSFTNSTGVAIDAITGGDFTVDVHAETSS